MAVNFDYCNTVRGCAGILKTREHPPSRASPAVLAGAPVVPACNNRLQAPLAPAVVGPPGGPTTYLCGPVSSHRWGPSSVTVLKCQS